MDEIETSFIPLTFSVGVQGMNFDNNASPWAMPELRWYYGYQLVWLLIIGILVGMLAYFRRKNGSEPFKGEFYGTRIEIQPIRVHPRQ